jgi:hypothetical protein
MMQIKDYRRDVNDVGLAAPLLKIPGSATAAIIDDIVKQWFQIIPRCYVSIQLYLSNIHRNFATFNEKVCSMR